MDKNDKDHKDLKKIYYSRIKLFITRFLAVIALIALCIIAVRMLTFSFPSAFNEKKTDYGYSIGWIIPDFTEIFDSNSNGFFNKEDKVCKYFFSTGDSTRKNELAYFRCDSNQVSLGVFTLSGIIEFGLVNKGRGNNDIWLLKSSQISSFSENTLIEKTVRIPSYYWVVTNKTDSSAEKTDSKKILTIRLKQDCKIGSLGSNALLRSGSSVKLEIGKVTNVNKDQKRISLRGKK